MSIEKEILIEVLRNPCDKHKYMDDLNAFVGEHPYCNSAIIALLQMMKKTDAGYDELLAQAAIRVGKRSVLRKALNPPHNAEKTKLVIDDKAATAEPTKTEIIERFISNEPRITPKDTDFKQAEELSQKSNDDKMSFVSETLASIYAKQGNKEKAKKIYNELALKYPKKSTYFADLIEKLEV